MGTSRDCKRIVREHRAMYLDPTNQAATFYEPIRSAFRRAVSSIDPAVVLDGAVRKATKAQLPHYEELQSGFMMWWSRTKATGVPVRDGEWVEGGLVVTLRQLIGVRCTDGTTFVVFPYVKSPEMNQAAADLLLRILEREMERLLPGGTPVVLDVRRSKTYRLRRNTNRHELDALLAGEAAKYVAHWQAAA
ncbi:hypothetical protein [Kibdelosporangium phytohabitans]|nr:hypothetical protein [Kibdelosporangium phytohabitans]MBE1471658.1 hypothetical protein [Kibdelosporangium phytohabitans]